MSINIDIEKVIYSANNISLNNKTISSEFLELEKAINTLNMSWESQASAVAMNTFNNIKQSYYEDRNTVVENYISFLLFQVGEIYTKTEGLISSAASEFK